MAKNSLKVWADVLQKLGEERIDRMAKSRKFMAILDEEFPLTIEAIQLCTIVSSHHQQIIRGCTSIGYTEEEFTYIAKEAKKIRKTLNRLSEEINKGDYQE